MDTVITSASNDTIKHIRKLTTSNKARRDMGVSVAEGVHLVQSYLSTGQSPLLCAYAESALQNQEVAELQAKLESTKAQKIVIADSLFESLTSLHAAVGVLVLFKPATLSESELLPIKGSAVLLDGVQDPGNLGTILRTAAATGVKNILLSPDCASPWSPKALRAGMGAQFGLDIYEESDLVAAIQTSKIPVFVTTLSVDSQSLYSVDLAGPSAWVFGSEGRGVSQQILNTIATHVHIPQAKTSVESLNVAAAAAVCLYEQYRQQAEV